MSSFELISLDTGDKVLRAPKKEDEGILQGGSKVYGDQPVIGSVTNLQALRDAKYQRMKDGDVIYSKSHTTQGDGGEGNFRLVTGAAPGTYVDNNGTIIVPTGGDGSAAWLADISYSNVYGGYKFRFLTGDRNSLASDVPKGIKVGDSVNITQYAEGSPVCPATWQLVADGAALPEGAVAGDVTGAAAGCLYLANGDAYYKFSLSGSPDVCAFGAMQDIDFDSLPAFNAAVATGRAVHVPDCEDGEYYLSGPITSVNFLSISGDDEVQGGSTRGAKIYAPNGFLLNETSVRHRVTISNLEIYGSGRADGKVGIDGYFGGKITGVYIRAYDVLMKNAFAFLIDIVRNKFDSCNIALYLQVTNETNVTNNWFGSGCIVPIDNYNLPPAPGGDRMNSPFTVSNNNFNVNTQSKASVLCGSLTFKENYIECFNGSSDEYLFEYAALRFIYPTLSIADNHVNSQGVQARFLNIYSDNSAGSGAGGEITRNWLRGFTSNPIKYGGKAGFYGTVTGIEIYDNQTTSSPYVDVPAADAPRVSTVSMLSYSANPGVSVAGTSYTRIPLELSSGFFGDVNAGVFNVLRPGLYRITATVTARYSTALSVFQIQIQRNGGSLQSAVHSLPIAAVGTNFQTVFIDTLAMLVTADDIEIRARSGETVSMARLTIERISAASIYAAE